MTATYRETIIAEGLAQEKSVLGDIRQQSFSRFQTLGFPTQKHEGWKYLNLEPILSTPFLSLPTSVTNTVKAETLPCGVTATTMNEIRPYLLPSIARETSAFVAINTAHFNNGVFVTVAAGATPDRPIDVTLTAPQGTTTPTVSYPRIVVVVKSGARAELSLTLEGNAEATYFMNAVVDLFVEDNAKLNVVQLQRASGEAIHFVTVNIHQQAGSAVTLTTAVQGGHVTRNDYRVTFAGEGASLHLNGTSLLSGKSRAYHHVHVDHVAPRCLSRQLQKNIVSGEAQCEWNSLVSIHRGAVGSDSDQLNRNIVLSRDARAITRPQLKVFNEDVKANHGATVGQLDPRELFYLRSRGLKKAEAYEILLRGFAEEAVQGVTTLQLRASLDQFVDEELARITL